MASLITWSMSLVGESVFGRFLLAPGPERVGEDFVVPGIAEQLPDVLAAERRGCKQRGGDLHAAFDKVAPGSEAHLRGEPLRARTLIDLGLTPNAVDVETVGKQLLLDQGEHRF